MNGAWPYARLCELLTGVRREEVVDPLREYRLLGIRLDGQGPFLRETVHGSETAANRLFRVELGDFIYSRLFAWRGAFGLVAPELDGCYVSGEFPTFILADALIDPKFLRYWFLLPSTLDRVKEDCSGSTPLTRNRFKEEFFLALALPLPPLEEQRRIVVQIEELNAKIREARSLRNDALAEADSVMAAAISARFAYAPESELPHGWAWKRLKDLLVDQNEGMTTGPFGTLLQRSDIQLEGVPVLGIANVQANRFVPGFSDFVAPWKAEALSAYALQPGDIVVARSGTVGRSCVVPDSIDPAPIMSTNLIRLRLNRDVFLPDLLCRLFNGSSLVERHKDSECRGSSRDFFTQRILSRLMIPTPGIADQRWLVGHLDNLAEQVDALKSLQTAAAAELDAMLPAILDRAFKGKL